MSRGLVIAAPASGSGKTLFTLGLLRRLRQLDMRVAGAKVGPDYIDPAFHAAASGRRCLNLDAWAMRAATLAAAARALAADAEVVVCEGVMGLFDGAAGEAGSTADLAESVGWPVVLVVDAKAQGASAAALVRGFATHRPGLGLAGVVFNRVGGARHAALLKDAMARALADVPVLGCLPRDQDLALPERHLGLVQAAEHEALEAFLDRAAAHVAAHADIAAVLRLARPAAANGAGDASPPFSLPGRRVAVARDVAFAFAYPHVLAGFQRSGCEVVPFSPLADEAPDESADAVYLPGGYPELHAGRLAANARFLDGVRRAAMRGAAVFGECGGYMVLGEGLIDAEGHRHAMAGLLPLETSFAERGLHLGYRRARLACATPLGAKGARFRGHEFHYAKIVREGPGQALFECTDASGGVLPSAGRVAGSVFGSFVHLIDAEDG